MKGYRLKRKRPVLRRRDKCLLGWLHSLSPTLTRYTNFRPDTLIGWHRKYVKNYWKHISKPGKRGGAGRPRLCASVRRIIVAIKTQNPRYGAGRISAIVSNQLGMTVSKSTVRNVLKRHRFRPTTPPGPLSTQSWKSFLNNQRADTASMDFKVVFDWRARPVYILNIIDHARRKLLACRATYHPSSSWVAQQLRNVFPFDKHPRRVLMDNDSIFLPIANTTLPNMGIEVVRTSVRSPWQNGIVERFNRTLKEELLDHIIPISDRHLNRLLAQYQNFYNTARPHQANTGESPCAGKRAANETAYTRGILCAEALPWFGGLHHSYRLAA
ncbi:MAG TPA: integrase core domain-containing protein [Noviherbaspirillum sp.]|nr:integrase core domain-containing protein [Noviherbaspirillum sp.]